MISTVSSQRSAGSTALEVLKSAASNSAARPTSNGINSAKNAERDDSQTKAIAKITALLMNGGSRATLADPSKNGSGFSESRINDLMMGGWFTGEIVMILPKDASMVSGTGGDDNVALNVTGASAPNYVFLDDGDDQLTYAASGDATSDAWQGRQQEAGLDAAKTQNTLSWVLHGEGIFGGRGDDRITVSAGRDITIVSGGDDNDVLTIAAGRDANVIEGGNGNDVLTIAAGRNVDGAYGGNGKDRVTVAAGSSALHIDGGDGDDVLTIAAGKSAESIRGGAGNDVIAVASGGSAKDVSGGSGDDIIAVSAQTVDSVGGGSGNDEIVINARTATSISGGKGDDTITIAGADKTSMFFGRGDGKDRVNISGETRIVFADRSIEDATITYGEGTVTISFADNGDSVTLNYSGAALKGGAPEIGVENVDGSAIEAMAPTTQESSYLKTYTDYSGAKGFALTFT